MRKSCRTAIARIHRSRTANPPQSGVQTRLEVGCPGSQNPDPGTDRSPSIYSGVYLAMNLPSVRFHVSNWSFNDSYVPPGESAIHMPSHGSLTSS
jgi:hypothetical protein